MAMGTKQPTSPTTNLNLYNGQKHAQKANRPQTKPLKEYNCRELHKRKQLKAN
jgi:hypothetical protein